MNKLCECFDDVLSKVEGKIKEKADRHDPESFKVDWANRSFEMSDDGGVSTLVSVPVKASYRRLKSSGQPYKHMVALDAPVAMSFCPFCGAKMREASSG